MTIEIMYLSKLLCLDLVFSDGAKKEIDLGDNDLRK